MKNALRRNAARRTVPGRPPFPSEWSREVESNHLQQAKEKNLRTPVPAYMQAAPHGAVCFLLAVPVGFEPTRGFLRLSVFRTDPLSLLGKAPYCPDSAGRGLCQPFIFMLTLLASAFFARVGSLSNWLCTLLGRLWTAWSWSIAVPNTALPP